MAGAETAARFELAGTAPAGADWIALVHGVSQDHRIFDRQVAAFGADYRLVLIDLPGHGLSADLPGPYGPPDYAEAIRGTLRKAGAPTCHLWGTHLGAASGLLLACQAPDLFRSLILESPVFPGRPLPSVAAQLNRVSEVARSEGLAAAREVWWREGDWFAVMREKPEDCRAGAHRAILEDFQGGPWLDAGLMTRPVPPLEAALSTLPLPVLLMNGAHDLADFVAVADDLEARLPDCRRVTVPEAGGFPLWEFPERVNALVADFLGSL